MAGVVAVGTIVSAYTIRSSDIDNQAARAANEEKAVTFRELLRKRGLWIFTGSVLLFHFANAAMLPLVGELAFLTGKLADPWGRKPLFLIGFGVLALRGGLYTFSAAPVYLLAVQSLDGVGAAIFGVLWVIIISDLAKGTGRFNLLQGVIQSALGVGAFLSNFLAGFVVKSFGFNTAFLGLAGIACAGMLFFGLFMPETREGTKSSKVEPAAFAAESN